MPHANRIISPWLGTTGNPDSFEEPDLSTAIAGVLVASPYAPGDLGNSWDYRDRTYQKVRLDSGATAATPTGVVAANQIAYWKDKSSYRVTNDPRFAENGGSAAAPNNVAGVFRFAVTANYQFWLLHRGRNIAVASDGNGAVGDVAVSLATGTNQMTRIAAGGAILWSKPLGVIRTAPVANVAYVDVDIPNIP